MPDGAGYTRSVAKAKRVVRRTVRRVRPVQHVQLYVSPEHETGELVTPERLERARGVVRALLHGVDSWSLDSENESERAMLSHTVRAIEAAEHAWVSRGGAHTFEAHARAIHDILDQAAAVTVPESPPYARDSAIRRLAESVRGSMLRHDGALASVTEDAIAAALERWRSAKERKRGRPKKGVAKDTTVAIVGDILRAAKLTNSSSDKAVHDAIVRARRAR
jgi:hypothetical protein